MKKLVTLLMGAALLLTASVQAQQIKGDFDKQTVWGKNGTIPDGWAASNVTQLGLKFSAAYKDENRTATEGKSVKMMNPFCGFGKIGANAPAYITLGTPWVYADITNVGKPSDTSDGGTHGGMNFTNRPDSLVGWIKRTHGTEKPKEVAKIITYLWKGTSSSSVTTGVSTKPVTVEMKDREKDILGIDTVGRKITGDAKLIASAEYTVEGDITEWTRVSIPLEYALKNHVISEKMNVIISSADYYHRDSLGKDNALWADDFKFVYNSKLDDITLNEIPLAVFDANKFVYDNLPMADGKYPIVAVTANGMGAKVEMVLNETNHSIVITVTGDDGGDNKHIYTLNFTPSIPSPKGPQLNGGFENQTVWAGTALESGGFGDGTEIEGWNGSNVIQMGFLRFALLKKEDPGYGNTGFAAKMTNRFCGFGTLGSNAPGYITIGKPWVYADIIGLLASMPNYTGEKDTDDSDGGSIGGAKFTYQPDSIVGYYKRTFAEEKPTEQANILAYLWKGTSTSMAPATSGDATGSIMQLLIDRDVDILGINNNGVPAAGVTLIASAKKTITAALPNWSRISVPLEYKSNEKPEKANVILSSADYFNRKNIGKDNVLCADEVAFVYNSKLTSLSIDGTPLKGFDKGKLAYTGLTLGDAAPQIVAVSDGKGATVTVGELANNKITIVVKGNDYDANEANVHTYTLTFNGSSSIDSNEASSVKAYAADGTINVSGNESEEVLIYTVQGVLVGQYAASENAIQTNLGKGIYIVKIGNYTTRVAL